MSTLQLKELSDHLAETIGKIEHSVVKIDDGTRLTASGLIWSDDGVIVATSHGVERDDELFVEFHDQSRASATVIGRDLESDIVVLKIEQAGLKPVQQSPVESVKVGNIVLAVGRPGRNGLQATFGIISSRYDAVESGRPESILGTDATLYPGFSGGGLFDVEGKFIGLLNLMFGRGSGVALGVSMVGNVVETILVHGQVKRGYLGVGTQVVALNQSLREQLSESQDRALLIVNVQSDSPAEKSGLTLGDLILAINNQTIHDIDDLRKQLRQHSAGDAVNVRILRGGTLTDISAVLGEDR